MNARQNKTILILDKDMNVLEDKILKNDEEIVIQKKKKELTEKQKEIIISKGKDREYCNKQGGYIQISYSKERILFKDLDIDRATVSRFIYLATFIDYNYRQENLLVKRIENNKVEAMNRNDIKCLLNLSNRAFDKFLAEVKKNNMLYEVDKKFYIDSDFATKGKCNFDSYTRVFLNTTRKLFENTTARKHKQLSYILELLPYTDLETNILMKDNKKMTLKDICEVLGVSTKNKQSMYKLLNSLSEFKVASGEKDHSIISYIKVKNAENSSSFFIISPNLVWGGRNIEKTKAFLNANFFDLF